MNKSLRLLITYGSVVGLTVYFGMFLKFMHWPGGGVVLLAGCLSLAVLGLIALWVLNRQEGVKAIIARSGKYGVYFQVALNAIVLALSVSGLSVVFRIMHWPGASYLMIIGMATISLGVLCLAQYIGWLNRKQDNL